MIQRSKWSWQLRKILEFWKFNLQNDPEPVKTIHRHVKSVLSTFQPQAVYFLFSTPKNKWHMEQRMQSAINFGSFKTCYPEQHHFGQCFEVSFKTDFSTKSNYKFPFVSVFEKAY